MTGSFEVEKVLAGDAASLVDPVSTSFTVDYSWPAGTGFPAGSGSVDVVVGSPATVDGVPYGAVVSLSERTPTAVSGATWGVPSISPSSVTIGDAPDTASFTVTNTLTADPVPPTATPTPTASTTMPASSTAGPTPTRAAPAEELASTGADGAGAQAVATVALVVVAIGVAILVHVRRRPQGR